MWLKKNSAELFINQTSVHLSVRTVKFCRSDVLPILPNIGPIRCPIRSSVDPYMWLLNQSDWSIKNVIWELLIDWKMVSIYMYMLLNVILCMGDSSVTRISLICILLQSFIENDKDLTKKVYILVLTSISNNLKMKRKFRNEFDFWGPCPCLHGIARMVIYIQK